MSNNLKFDDELENNKQKLVKMEKKVRQNELKLYPYENWINNKYVNLDEKEKSEFLHSVEAVKKLWEAASKIDPDLAKK